MRVSVNISPDEYVLLSTIQGSRLQCAANLVQQPGPPDEDGYFKFRAVERKITSLILNIDRPDGQTTMGSFVDAAKAFAEGA